VSIEPKDSDVFAIRTSDRGTFKRCRTLWDYKSPLRQRLEPIEGPKPLEFGIAIHSALETYYDPELRKLPDLEVVEQLAIGKFNEDCAEQTQRRKDAGLWDDAAKADFEERRELGEGMLNHYFTWAPENDKNWTPILSEVSFEVPVPWPQGVLHDDVRHNWDFDIDIDGNMVYEGKPVVYQGRIDLIIQDSEGYYWIVDHKTAAQFGDTSHLDMDEQCGSYGWAIHQQLGIPIRGIIYNELRKAVPKPPKRLQRGGFSVAKNQSTTYELYLRTLEGAGENLLNYKEFLKWLSSQQNTFIRRSIVHRTNKEFELLAHRIGLEAIEMLGDPFIYPSPNRMNCAGCSFRAPCLARMDGSDEHYFLNDSGLFTRK
jgi:hypothetical protein